MNEPDGGLQEALAAREGVLLAWDFDRGEAAATIARNLLHETCAWLHEAQGFARLSDIVGIDTLDYPIAMPGQFDRGTPRFGVIYHLAQRPPTPGRLRLRVFAPADDATVPSVTDIWPGADFFEREIYDLIGVRFSGHPNLRRIMMPEDYGVHPLRKDIGLGGEPIEFSHTIARVSRGRRKANA